MCSAKGWLVGWHMEDIERLAMIGNLDNPSDAAHSNVTLNEVDFTSQSSILG